MKHLMVVLLALVALCVPASAETRIVSQFVPNAQLVGEARLKYLIWNVFDAELYAPYGRWKPDAPFALTLNYLRKISGKAIVDRSVSEMRRLGVDNEAKLAGWRRDMEKLFSDVSTSTRITGIRDQNGNAVFLRNGRRMGEIRDPDFSKSFFDIWLSDKASDLKFQRKLVGRDY